MQLINRDPKMIMRANGSPGRQPSHKLANVAAAAAGCGILAGFIYTGDILLNHIFMRMPCASVPFYQRALPLAPTIYLLAGVTLLVGVRLGRRAIKIAGVVFGLVATVLFALAALANSLAQAACQTRSLKEAMLECHASPAAYAFRSVRTWTTITPVAPKSMDKAFFCLSMWASTHPEYSMDVDTSVDDFAPSKKIENGRLVPNQ